MSRYRCRGCEWCNPGAKVRTEERIARKRADALRLIHDGLDTLERIARGDKP
jgi:hypothetical protein